MDGPEDIFGPFGEVPVVFLEFFERLQEFWELPALGMPLEACFDGGDLIVAIEGQGDGGDAGALEFSLGGELLAMVVIEADDGLAMPGRDALEANRQLVARSWEAGFARVRRSYW